MSDSTSNDTTQVEPFRTSDAPRPTKRAVIIAVLVAGLVGAWMALGVFARSQVDVSWPNGVKCTGTAFLSNAPGATITMEPGMRCEIPVEVRNSGWVPVAVDRLTMPLMGPEGGVSVMLEDPDGFKMLEDPEGGVDAIIEMGRVLSRGEAAGLTLTLVFRDRGCNSEGSTTYGDGFPTATVSALGWSKSVASPETLTLKGSAASSCDF